MFIAVLSDQPAKRKEFCKLVGKETGNGDISFYSSNFQGTIRTLIEPSLYPDKLQPLLYTLSIADYVVVIADGLTPALGELIVTLDSLRKEKGILISSVELPIAKTVLEKYIHLQDFQEAKEKILSLPVQNSNEDVPFALVDSAFSVKSVGNVVLGALKSGLIKKRDKLLHLPSQIEMEVKNIQLNDKDVTEVSAGGRFGISYKGGLIERGILTAPSNSFSLAKSLLGQFTVSPFYKASVPKKIHAYLNLQFIEGTLEGQTLVLEKQIAFRQGERILITDPGSSKLRICGVFTPK